MSEKIGMDEESQNSVVDLMACLERGYCLRGLAESRCPECGKSFDLELVMRRNAAVQASDRYFKNYSVILVLWPVIVLLERPLFGTSALTSVFDRLTSDHANNMLWKMTFLNIPLQAVLAVTGFYCIRQNNASTKRIGKLSIIVTTAILILYGAYSASSLWN